VIKLGNDLTPEAIAVGLDLTDRVTQSDLRAEQLPWSKGKCFRGSGIIGGFYPFTGQFDDLCNGDYSLELTVNGESRQVANLSTMSITPQQQMGSLLTWAPVVAGDYLFTGTPSGVAELQVGDEVDAILIGKDGSVISQISSVCV
jgi:2-keto-4-pentenoate hydratase/2-oxohepta-3-ene-1,7-dioic acid hydratase in catechol pathway